MIGLGLRLEWLGSPALSWRDLLVIVRQAPLGSAIHRAMDPEAAPWGLAEHLLALQHDRLAELVWLGTEDATKGRNRPKPLPRPGVAPSEDEQHFGGAPRSLDEMAAWLARRNPGQHGGGSDA